MKFKVIYVGTNAVISEDGVTADSMCIEGDTLYFTNQTPMGNSVIRAYGAGRWLTAYKSDPVEETGEPSAN